MTLHSVDYGVSVRALRTDADEIDARGEVARLRPGSDVPDGALEARPVEIVELIQTIWHSWLA